MTTKDKNKLFDPFLEALLRAEGKTRRLLLSNAKTKDELLKFAAGAYYDIYSTLAKENLPKEYKKAVEKAWRKLKKDIDKRLKQAGIKPSEVYKGTDIVNYMKRWGGLQVDYLTRRYSADLYMATIEAAYSVDFKDAVAQLESKLPLLSKRYSKTLVETSWRTMESGYTINQAEKVGVQKFRYDGPEDAKNRQFCAEHVGKIYTLDEIKQMYNDFGQSAWIYRGGWNCRHYWTPIVE